MTLRVNLSRIDRERYRQQLEDAGFASRAGRLSGAALTLEEPRDVALLPGFSEGLCSVQDEAAQLAAMLLSPRPGENILDACAAPGGKSGHLLELQPKLARLRAMDISAERLQRVEDNLHRLGLSADLLCGNAADPPASLREAAPFDAMLVDVPCSATGVIRRHPDIKLLRRPEDGASFAREQGAILKGLWPLLRDGGRLLYVTCSILPQENSAVIGEFLAAQRDAREEPVALTEGESCLHGKQLLPDPEGADGLYFALLRKAKT
jgi:16S rRNA (cytosine967-C5)-methyltransferase